MESLWGGTSLDGLTAFDRGQEVYRRCFRLMEQTLVNIDIDAITNANTPPEAPEVLQEMNEACSSIARTAPMMWSNWARWDWTRNGHLRLVGIPANQQCCFGMSVLPSIPPHGRFHPLHDYECEDLTHGHEYRLQRPRMRIGIIWR